MELNLGGPVWHASARCNTVAQSKELAMRALVGVGDASLGQWVEVGSMNTVHVRRRVAHAEAALVGPLRDIRDTDEEQQRREDLFAASPRLRAILANLQR